MAIKYDMSRDTFDSAEKEMARAINEAGEKSSGSISKTALGIGASYLLYRRFMHRRLKEEAATSRHLTTADAVGELATRIFGAYMKAWIPTLVINLSLG